MERRPRRPASRRVTNKRDAKNFRISNSTNCALVIANGGTVGLSCYQIVLPYMHERADLLGTVGARMEAGYLACLMGIGLLVSTAFALVSLGLLRRCGRSA